MTTLFQSIYDKNIIPKDPIKIYDGYNIYSYITISALLKEFPGIFCCPLTSNINKSNIFISTDTFKKDYDIINEIDERFKLAIEKCFNDTSTRFIAIPLSLKWNEDIKIKRHANIIIVDKNLKKFIIFEPNSSDIAYKYDKSFNKTNITDYITVFLNTLKPQDDNNYVYIHCIWAPTQMFEGVEINNNNNNKIIENSGMCLTHSLFFCWLFFLFYTDEIYKHDIAKQDLFLIKKFRGIIKNIKMKLPYGIQENIQLYNFITPKYKKISTKKNDISSTKKEINFDSASTEEDIDYDVVTPTRTGGYNTDSYNYLCSIGIDINTFVTKILDNEWIHKSILRFNGYFTDYIFAVIYQLLEFYNSNSVNSNIDINIIDKIYENFKSGTCISKDLNIQITNVITKVIDKFIDIKGVDYVETNYFTIKGIEIQTMIKDFNEIHRKSSSKKRRPQPHRRKTIKKSASSSISSRPPKKSKFTYSITPRPTKKRKLLPTKRTTLKNSLSSSITPQSSKKSKFTYVITPQPSKKRKHLPPKRTTIKNRLSSSISSRPTKKMRL
jgi:hypothetical protein